MSEPIMLNKCMRLRIATDVFAQAPIGNVIIDQLDDKFLPAWVPVADYKTTELFAALADRFSLRFTDEQLEGIIAELRKQWRERARYADYN